MDLSTTYLGLSLRTPLVPSASPLSEEVDSIRRLEDATGAAIRAPGFPPEMVDDEPEEPGYEVEVPHRGGSIAAE